MHYITENETISSILEEIETLTKEHEELNQIIDSNKSQKQFDQLTLQRFKKRRLVIKDRIEQLKIFLYPDIIA